MKLMRWFSALVAPLCNEAGVVPSQLTDDYDALLTTTRRAMQPRIRDNITRGNRVLAWLDANGQTRFQDGGERIQVPLMHSLNSTVDIYQGYGTISTTPQDGITSAFYTWSQIGASTSISRKEERQNSGASRLISLLESKETQTMNTVREMLNNCIVSGRITASADEGRFLALQGTLDTSASGPLPLGAIIDTQNNRNVAIGNINPNTHSFWRNVSQEFGATNTFAALKKEMNEVYNDTSKGVGGSPDLMIGDEVAWETYFNALQSQERYFVTAQRVIDVLGGPTGDNSSLLRFRGAVFIWDEVVPDLETNATVVNGPPGTAGVGTVTLSNIWFICTPCLEWVTDSQTDFIMTPMVRPIGQDARTGMTLWMGAMGTNNRRKLGLLYGINQSITS